LRIIHGKYGSRRLSLPKNINARPTTDQAKESLFNILINRVDFSELIVLDLFSGTGSISLEFASLGSPDITLVEKDKQMVMFIRKNIGLLNIDGIKVIHGDVFTFLKRQNRKYDIIFADPPFDLPGIANLPDLIIPLLAGREGYFILEHGPNLSFTNHPLHRETRKYGKVNFSFFSI